MTRAIPRPAATVIVLREHPTASSEAEVFLVKRHRKNTFMANAHVFPGGRVDESDKAPAIRERTKGWEVLESHCPGMDADDALGYHVAAFRELFEEAGVLVAVDEHGAFFDARAMDVRIRLDKWRKRLNAGEVNFARVLEGLGLQLRLDVLKPFAHWITPSIEPRRYDTRFFITRLPPGQVPAHDEIETVAGEWMTPAAALRANREGRIGLAPPTLRTLEELRDYGSVEATFAAVGNRRIVPIEPRFIQKDGEITLLLPGDPLYPVSPDKAVEGPTRVRLDQRGRWWSTTPLDDPTSDDPT